jgi:glycosyltransferase involved in cell wall biosynthesis
MISICIPVYNFNISKLVKGLAEQVALLSVSIEIIVIDDHSDNIFRTNNKRITEITGVKYFELDENIGRSKIRNLFLQYTNRDYMLFIDCDAEICNPGFLKNYIDSFDGQSVIAGGVAYSPSFPGKDYSLRWTYGHKRESTNATDRNNEPFKSFKTFNFAVPRHVFEKIHFDETVNGYGHEDTLYGLGLKKIGIKIKHIENPLIHIGLEPNDMFIKKTRQGIENLMKLYISTKEDKAIEENIKLLNIFVNLNPVLKLFVFLVFKLTCPLIEFSLKQKKPNLTLFDFYKLGYMCTLK